MLWLAIDRGRCFGRSAFDYCRCCGWSIVSLLTVGVVCLSLLAAGVAISLSFISAGAVFIVYSSFLQTVVVGVLLAPQMWFLFYR